MIKKRELLTEKINLIKSQKTELKELDSELNKLYKEIIDKEKELRLKRSEIISRWKDYEDRENPFLIIELQSMSDAENANKTFLELFLKPGGEFANDICIINDDNSSEMK